MAQAMRSKIARPTRQRPPRRTGRGAKIGAGSTQFSFGFERMTRVEALRRIQHYLLRRSPTHASALQLMHLFNVQPEELADLGLSYEHIRLLERYYGL